MNLPETIEQNGQRVLTTAQLAGAYGTDSRIISNNFNRNRERYIEGKHFYCLTGEELKAFHQIDDLPCNVGKLYLWTEKGALLHAKSLNTDKAWEVYEFLIESYFRKAEEIKSQNYSELSPMLQYLIQMEQRQNAIEQRQDKMEQDMKTKLEVDRTELIKNVLAFESIGSFQRKEIAKAVKSRAIDICHQNIVVYDKVGKRVIDNIYNALQKKFEVESYIDLKQHQFVDAITFIQCFMPDDKLEMTVLQAFPKPDMHLFNALFDTSSEENK